MLLLRSRISQAGDRLRPLDLGGSNLFSSYSTSSQTSSGNAQVVKIVALSAIGLFVPSLINRDDKADADSVISISAHIANYNISRAFSILR